MTTKLALMLALFIPLTGFVGVCSAQDTTKTIDKLVLSKSALTSQLDVLVKNYQDLEKRCGEGEKQIAAWKETMRQIEGGVSTLRRCLSDSTLLYVEPEAIKADEKNPKRKK